MAGTCIFLCKTCRNFFDTTLEMAGLNTLLCNIKYVSSLSRFFAVSQIIRSKYSKILRDVLFILILYRSIRLINKIVIHKSKLCGKWMNKSCWRIESSGIKANVPSLLVAMSLGWSSGAAATFYVTSKCCIHFPHDSTPVTQLIRPTYRRRGGCLPTRPTGFV